MLSPSILAVFGLLSSTVFAVPTSQQLSMDDVIVVKTDGTTQVMKAAEWDAINTLSAVPTQLKNQTTASNTAEIVPAARRRRRCDESTEVQVMSRDEFLNWDIALSPVISSAGGAATVSISKGHSLSNSVSTSASLSASFLEGILGASLSVTFDESWTTTEQQSMSFAVPAGKNGVIVSQPYVRRTKGFVLSGCSDSFKKDEFTADSYESQTFGNLEWVKGIIRLCSSDQYPIPFCIGEGSHT